MTRGSGLKTSKKTGYGWGCAVIALQEQIKKTKGILRRRIVLGSASQRNKLAGLLAPPLFTLTMLGNQVYQGVSPGSRRGHVKPREAPKFA